MLSKPLSKCPLSVRALLLSDRGSWQSVVTPVSMSTSAPLSLPAEGPPRQAVPLALTAAGGGAAALALVCTTAHTTSAFLSLPREAARHPQEGKGQQR